MLTAEQKENVKKLANVLRTDEYKQAHSSLRNTEGFCCLGVACDLYRKETGKGEWTQVAQDDCYDFNIGPVRSTAFMPNLVSNFYGFISDDIEFVAGWGSIMNDNGTKFTEIADMLEKEYINA